MRYTIWLICALSGFAATPLAAQTIAVTGGTVYPVSGPRIENGTVLIRDGRIMAVGADIIIPDDAHRVDARGKWVTPGLLNAATQIGLIEISAVPGTREGSLSGNDISASFNVLEGINPASQLIPVTRVEGITTVLAGPSGGLIAGQAVAIDLAGERIEDMAVRSPVAIVANISESAKTAGGGSRAGVMARLRRVLEDAREYDRRRQDFQRGQIRPLAAEAADLEAMLPVLRREIPLLVTANRRSDIENALRLGHEFNLRIILMGAEEGWQVADRIAAAGVPVVVDPLQRSEIPVYDALNPRYDNAALLAQAGVLLVLASFDTHNARNVRQSAGNAVAYGLLWDHALRAVTLEAASVLGLGDRYGSLESGKVANVVIWSGDPFEFATAAEAVYIRGRLMPNSSRQKELLERYRTLPPTF